MQSQYYSNGKPASAQLNLERYRDGLLRYLSKLTGDREDAEDLTQETFLRAIKNAHTLRDEGSIKRWLYRIATNLSNSRCRDRAKHPLILSCDLNGYGYGELDNEYPGNGVDNRGHLEERICAESYLPLVPGKYSAPLKLNSLGFSYDEIAEELSIPVGTVKSRIWRGRNLTNSLLNGRC